MERPAERRIGLDLGGTKIEGVVLEADGSVGRRLRRATPSGDYDATIAALCELVFALEKGGPELSVGVGTPGAISPATGLVKNANSVCLNGRPLKRDLERALGRPVRVANDANCFALSEAVDGAGRGAQVVFGVILGTGVGGGVVMRGRPWIGANAIAGEWGHNPLPAPRADELPGPRCYCGRRGCIESWLSGGALAREHEAAGGARLEATAVAAAADAGDARARESLERYAERLARALSSVINVLDPDCVVLGGGLSKIELLYRRVPELWGTSIFSDRVDTRLAPPVHGDSSGVRGAAWLWGDAGAER